MSGDAQPRKRKNKGKKKDIVVQRPDELIKERLAFRKSGLSADDAVEEEIYATLKNSTDEVIHVQKDISLGGNVVTKLVFFCLLATIGVMVGIILLEFRGSTDEETTSAVDSPWSITLERWVDKEPDSHAHEKESLEDEHDDHEPDVHVESLHDKGSSGGIFSWFGFGEGEVEETEHDASDAEEEGYSFLSFLPFVGNREDSEVKEKEESGGGGWFGFGQSEKETEIEEVEQETDEEEDNVEEIEEDEEAEHEEDLDKEEVLDEDENESEEHSEREEEQEQDEEDELDEEEEIESAEFHRSEKNLKDISEEEEEDDKFSKKEEEDDEVENLSNEEEEEEDELDNLSKEEEDDTDDFSKEKEENDTDDLSIEKEEDDADDISKEKEEDDADDLSKEKEEDDDVDRLEEEDEERVDDSKEEVAEDTLSEEEDHGNLSEEELHREDDEEEQDKNYSGLERDQDEIVKEELAEKSPSKEKSEEELFPEAIEALRREAEELAAKAQALKEDIIENSPEEVADVDSGNESPPEDDETEGMALKFGVGVALVVVAHIVLVKKWNSWAGEDSEDPLAEVPATTELKEEMHEEFVASAVTKTESQPPPLTKTEPPPTVPAPPLVPHPTPAAPVEKPAEDSPVEEDEEEVEEEGEYEEEESEDLEIDKDKFRELIAKYGQDTPESSDIEQSDDDIQKVEYSGGEDSPAEEEAEDSPAEVVPGDELVPSDDEMKEWTGIKKSDIRKITKLDSESEGEVEEEEEEEEEEESEDEPPPPPPKPARQRGGPKDMEEDYQNTFITNDEDWFIREELDRADEEFNYEKARTLFKALLVKHPNSPRARYGLARTYDEEAEKLKSNEILNIAITGYQNALSVPKVPDLLFINIASRLINRLRFRGQHLKAVDVHNQMIQKFNSTPEYRTDLAITYLMINRLENARKVLKEVLSYWPEDPTALAHYGLVLKLQGNIHGCVKYLEKGLETDFTTTKDARLFFHLGDALFRVGREEDAVKVYDKAVAYGLFRSRYQRSLYNVDRLTARPWWTLEETTYASFFKLLEENWIKIRDEGIKALKLDGLYRDEAEGLRDKGDWKQFELFARGSKFKKNCEVTPFTCSLIGSFDPAASCKRGQTKFSIMEGGTHVWPHCGPTNCRLRAHLGLIVPEGPEMRVATVKKKWKEGKVFVFDDSFEHEVWHNGSSLRLVLIVDVWHPELTVKEKLSLSPI